jgi:hypothetical protein
MNGSHDTDDTDQADQEATLDPQSAAALIDETQRQARRQLNPDKPLLLVGAAAFFLVAYGVMWLSVLGQNPYVGPTGAALVIFYVLVLIVSIAGAVVGKRAQSGISGPLRRQQRGQAVALAATYVGVFTFQGALRYLGISYSVVYGVYAVSVPLIAIGAIGAGIGATREDWPLFGVSIAIIVVAAASAFAGPIGAWGIVALGGCVALLGDAIAQYILLKRA